MDADPYVTLGVSRDASRSEIQQAFRELKTHHDADASRDEQAEARFQRVSEAHALLTSPSRRRSFDNAHKSARGEAGAAGVWATAVEQPKSTRPRYELTSEDPQHHHTLLRMALMYGPLTIGALLVALVPLVSLLEGNGGAVVPLVLLLVVAAALAFQAVTALRDLRSKPMFTRGEVQRTWSKGGFMWFFRSHFMMVNRQVFVVPPEVFVRVNEGEVVECHHWPHTRTVVRVLLLLGEDAELQSSDPIIPI